MRTEEINAYECPDGHLTVTIDLEDGTTPMMMNCRNPSCGKVSRSKWYKVDQNLKPTFEWFKPTDMKKLNPAERDHVQRGGLLIRKIVNHG